MSDCGGTEAIRASRVVKRYGDAVALGPIDLRVAGGEMVALLGPNGAGKSTLLALAAGLLEPTDGQLYVFDETPGSLAARRLVSYVPDTPALYDDLSIAETAQYVARLAGASDSDDRVVNWLRHFGLADRANQVPAQLSRGLRQRAALVVGLARPFRLLLLDEPFATLDVRSGQLLRNYLQDCTEGGAAVVVASHQNGYLPSNCRPLRLREGRVEQTSTLP